MTHMWKKFRSNSLIHKERGQQLSDIALFVVKSWRVDDRIYSLSQLKKINSI